MVKTEIPKSMHKALKVKSAKDGLYMKTLIRKAIRNYLINEGEYDNEE